ncbi:Cof-type HAD-IIB family hydrolase [Streptococcus entericus]|uniref:Cof-type HAD-IIB family hydrolase n=1 Tax=Streptococcus entericus TaxID=155680 RepID=UPI000379691C|nr:Cof-type HAD-IIB family hydrolase [Streptococcus entericus]
MSKYIFLDIDGTLVDYDMKIPESARVAIARARQAGHKVFICSGRSKAEIYPELWDLGLDGFIGGNGAYIDYQGQILKNQVFTHHQTREMVDWLQAKHLGFYLESPSGLYASPDFVEKAATIYDTDLNQSMEKIRSIFPDMIYGADLYRDDVAKISFRLNSLADYEEAKALFRQAEVGFWSGTGKATEFGDLGQPDTHKAGAIRELLMHLGVILDDTIAFGDAENDQTMLGTCHIGVAMGNARDSLKATADYVTDDVTRDGLYKAFVHLKLIEEEERR